MLENDVEMTAAYLMSLDFFPVNVEIFSSAQPIKEVALSEIGIVGRGPGGYFLARNMALTRVFTRRINLGPNEVVTHFNVRMRGNELEIDYSGQIWQRWEPISISKYGF